MSDQQANALRVGTRTLEDLADAVEADLPVLDQSNYDEVIRDVSATDTPFAERWDAIKACVDTHLERLSLDEPLDRTTYDYVAISGGHPSEHRALTLSATIQRGASFLKERRNSDGGRNGAASREERSA